MTGSLPATPVSETNYIDHVPNKGLSPVTLLQTVTLTCGGTIEGLPGEIAIAQQMAAFVVSSSKLKLHHRHRGPLTSYIVSGVC